ncbi:hypothetical protein LY90DRAFT_700991 [Neocallimastix californiae]|uniref:DH domain-containing protein n=1 Tax=Neocallimastix californiae TaxID=1754190 RepID=A0A1Y2DU36_9FUNG|nr:hypothetical protein LY90DRAFT_700991 [Neocallimastix californiae]|eukprot:ORY62757.1 hypothetical protein LY90DRAFT_700991 [Neocallimastix californiae]
MSTNNNSESLQDLNETKIITNSINNIKACENDVNKSSNLSLNKTTPINSKKPTVISTTSPNKGRPRTTSLSNQNKSKVKVLSNSNTEKINATNPSKIIPSLTKTASTTTKTFTSNSTNSSTTSLKPNIITNVKSKSTTTLKPKSKVTSTSTTVKPKVTSTSTTVKPKVSTHLNSVKPKVSTHLNSVKPKVSSSLNSVKPKVSSSLNSVKPKVSSSLNSVKPKISSTHNTVKSSINSNATSTTLNKIKSTPNSDVPKKTRSTLTVNTLSKTKSSTGSSLSTITKPKTSLHTSKVTSARLNSTTNSRLKPSTASTSTIKSPTSSTLKKPSVTTRPRSSLSSISTSSNASKIKTSPTYTSSSSSKTSTTHVRRKKPSPYANVKAKVNSLPSKSLSKNSSVSSNITVKPKNSTSITAKKSSTLSNTDITVKKENQEQEQPCLIVTTASIKKDEKEKEKLVENITKLEEDKNQTTPENSSENVNSLSKALQDISKTDGNKLSNISPIETPLLSSPVITNGALKHDDTLLPQSSPGISKLNALNTDIIKTTTINNEILNEYIKNIKYDPANVEHIDPNTLAFGDDEEEEEKQAPSTFIADSKHYDNISVNTDDFLDCESSFSDTKSSLISEITSMSNLSTISSLSSITHKSSNHSITSGMSIHALKSVFDNAAATQPLRSSPIPQSTHKIRKLNPQTLQLFEKPSSINDLDKHSTTTKIYTIKSTSVGLSKASSIPSSPTVKARVDSNFNKLSTTKSTSIGLSKVSSSASSPSLRQTPLMKAVKARVDSNFNNKSSVTKSTTSIGLSRSSGSSPVTSPSLRQTPLMKAVKARVDSNFNTACRSPSATSVNSLNNVSLSPIRSKTPTIHNTLTKKAASTSSVINRPGSKTSINSTVNRNKTPTISSSLPKNKTPTLSSSLPKSTTSTKSTVTRNKTPTLSGSLSKTSTSTSSLEKSSVTRTKTPTLSSSLSKTSATTGSLDKLSVTRTKTPTLSNSLSKSSPKISSATPTPPSPLISSKPVHLSTTIPRRNTRVTSLQPEAKDNLASSSEITMPETEDELEPMNESESLPPANDEKNEIGVSDIYKEEEVEEEEEEFHDSNDGTFLTDNVLIAEPETIKDRKEEAIPSYTVKKHTLDQSQICEITEDSFILNQYVEDNNYFQTKHSNHEELIGDLIHAELIIDQIKQEAKRKAEEFKLNYEKEKKELENQKLEEKEGSIENEQYDDVETETLNEDDGMSLGSISVKKLLKKNISSIIKPKNFTNLIKKRSSVELNESFESNNSLSDNNSEVSAISEKRDSKGSTSYVLSMFMQSFNGANSLIKKKKNGESTEDMKISISGPYQNNEVKPYDAVSLDSNLLGPPSNKPVIVPLNTTIEIPKRVSSAVPYSDDDSLSSSVASNSFKMNKFTINYPMKLDASSTIQSTPLKLLNKSIEKNKHISADSAIYLNDSITYENIKEIINEEWTDTLNKQKFGVSDIREENESDITTENGSSTSIGSSLKTIQNNEILRHLSISHESIMSISSEANEEISEAQAVLQKQLKKINNIIYEITTTERTYVNELGKLLEIYYYPMDQNQVLNNNEMNILYSNIVDIYQFHSEIFYPKLELVQKEHEKNIKLIKEMDAFKSSSSIKLINETISIEAFFKIVSWPFQFLYKPYYINFKKASDFVTILNGNQKHKYNSNNILIQAEEFGFNTNYPIFERENKKKFKKLRAFLKSSTERMDHKQVDILGYLILPIQRLPRYLLLLEGLAKSTKLLEEAVAKLVPKGSVLKKVDEEAKKDEEEEEIKKIDDTSIKNESKKEEEEVKEEKAKKEDISSKDESNGEKEKEDTSKVDKEKKEEEVKKEELKDTLNKSSNETRNNIESRKANDRTERAKKAPVNVKSMIAQIESNNNSKIPARSGVRNNTKSSTKINKNGNTTSRVNNNNVTKVQTLGSGNSIRDNNKNIHSGIPTKINNNDKISTVDIKEEEKEEEKEEKEEEKEEIKIEEIKEEEEEKEKEEIKVEEIKEEKKEEKEEEKEEIKVEEITESNDDDKNNDDTGSKKELEKKENNNENEKLMMDSSVLSETNNNSDNNHSFSKTYTIAMAAEDIKNIIELCNKAISS